MLKPFRLHSIVTESSWVRELLLVVLPLVLLLLLLFVGVLPRGRGVLCPISASSGFAGFTDCVVMLLLTPPAPM